MLKAIKIFFNKTIKRQLIIAVVLTHAVMMSIFIFDITSNQEKFLHKQSLNQAINLTKTLSKNSTSWVLSDDYIGMEEIIESIALYPNLQYAMLLDKNSKVLAHTNNKYLNKYVSDKVSQKIITSNDEVLILVDNKYLIDVAVKVMRDSQHIAWARISISQDANVDVLNEVVQKGITYTLIAIILGSIFSYLLGVSLTNGLNNLIEVSKEHENGNKQKRANEERIDEIGTLSRQINTMFDSMQSSEKRIEKQREDSIKTEELLIKSRHLADMGEMIGNIAHQWRQPLSIISTYASGLLFNKSMGNLSDEHFEKSCKSIENNVQYLSTTIDDFRNFVKGDRIIEYFLISDMIDSYKSLTIGVYKSHDITLVLNLQDKLHMNGYRNELIQCLINISNNSKDAIIENDVNDGLIFISSYEENNNIIITIKDNALGIPSKIIDKIFEPYFTTKHKSQGTGIGLNMTYKFIVEGMSGTIVASNVSYKYENTDYKGALITITIPKI